ncbi:hypothetical protein E2C01_003320 [Portunus trituberculatus]|uniref:HTH psq-type domain-containing protein n=1 Tax=Portunus trituberculatus TaxID=210409 RepID=A0A5B7CMJ7_PORTR|nr:hypothetical protein [Portunus trituberculatus]
MRLAVTPLCLHSPATFYNLCFHLASFIITMPKVPKETGKKKKVVLTIQQKLEILAKLKGTSIAHKYGIGNATSTDIKKAGPQLSCHQGVAGGELSNRCSAVVTCRLVVNWSHPPRSPLCLKQVHAVALLHTSHHRDQQRPASVSIHNYNALHHHR